MVAKKSLVTQTTGVEHVAAPATPTLGKTANAAQVERIPSESAGAPASCLETITQGIRSAGLSKDVAERVARDKLQVFLKGVRFSMEGVLHMVLC